MLKKNIKRYRLIETHINMVKAGQYEAAAIILRLLRKGEIRLGIGDADFAVEMALESAGVAVRYNRNCYSAYARL